MSFWAPYAIIQRDNLFSKLLPFSILEQFISNLEMTEILKLNDYCIKWNTEAFGGIKEFL